VHTSVVYDDLSSAPRWVDGPKTVIEANLADMLSTRQTFKQCRVGAVIHLAEPAEVKQIAWARRYGKSLNMLGPSASTVTVFGLSRFLVFKGLPQ
jgi:hypothetical protein